MIKELCVRDYMCTLMLRVWEEAGISRGPSAHVIDSQVAKLIMMETYFDE